MVIIRPLYKTVKKPMLIFFSKTSSLPLLLESEKKLHLFEKVEELLHFTSCLLAFALGGKRENLLAIAISKYRKGHSIP